MAESSAAHGDRCEHKCTHASSYSRLSIRPEIDFENEGGRRPYMWNPSISRESLGKLRTEKEDLNENFWEEQD